MKALSFVLAGMLLVGGAFLIKADEEDRLTKVTFSAPVEVPGKILPAGTYVFKLADSLSDRNIVEIYTADQKHLEDLVLAIPDKRLRPTGKPMLQFAEGPAGSPEVLKAWFYPGMTWGEQFVYPHDRAAELARTRHEAVYSTTDSTSDAGKMKHAHVKAIQPNGQESDLPPSQ